MGTTKIVGKLKNACLKNNQDREARMKRKFFSWPLILFNGKHEKLCKDLLIIMSEKSNALSIETSTLYSTIIVKLLR